MLAAAKGVVKLIEQGTPAEEEARFVERVADVEQILFAEVAPPKLVQRYANRSGALLQIGPHERRRHRDDGDLVSYPVDIELPTRRRVQVAGKGQVSHR